MFLFCCNFYKFYELHSFSILKRRSSRGGVNNPKSSCSCSHGLAGEGWRPWPCSRGRPGRWPSTAVRPSVFLSFAAASMGTRGRVPRVARGLSTTTVGSGSAARARAVPRGIVASSVGSPACLVGFNLHLLGGCGNGKMFFSCSFCRSRIMACCGSGLAWF